VTLAAHSGCSLTAHWPSALRQLLAHKDGDAHKLKERLNRCENWLKLARRASKCGQRHLLALHAVPRDKVRSSGGGRALWTKEEKALLGLLPDDESAIGQAAPRARSLALRTRSAIPGSLTPVDARCRKQLDTTGVSRNAKTPGNPNILNVVLFCQTCALAN
jgi:hypothetical protein